MSEYTALLKLYYSMEARVYSLEKSSRIMLQLTYLVIGFLFTITSLLLLG